MPATRRLAAAILAFVSAFAASAGAQPCIPEWSTDFTWGQPDAAVRSAEVLNTGDGPALYLGGFFQHFGGGADARGIVKWDGLKWSPLGAGIAGWAYSMAAFDDGSGPSIFVGGAFSEAGGVSVQNIGRWDGAQWHRLGLGTPVPLIRALAVFDDGKGPALYAGGDGYFPGGYVRGVGRWDGSKWQAVGGNVGGSVWALTVMDDGNGPALFVGGDFPEAGFKAASNIARWDGAEWSPLGLGTNDVVRCLRGATLDGKPRLFAGGAFTAAGGVSAAFVASWDGLNWSPLGAGVWAENLDQTNVNSLEVFDDGSGPALYAGGDFDIAGEVQCNNVARWDGHQWTDLFNGLKKNPNDKVDWVGGLAVFDQGEGPKLFAGGQFKSSYSTYSPFLQSWDGAAWSQPTDHGFSDPPVAYEVFDDGAGPMVYVSGWFGLVDGQSTNGIARTADGIHWDRSISYLAPMNALEVFDDGNGEALYAGAYYSQLARWTGKGGWSVVRTFPFGWGINTLCADHASGRLYIGGDFSESVGGPSNHVLSWDGQSWDSMAGGLDGTASTMALFDDGAGSALFVGGQFTTAGGQSARSIARWDGAHWSALGTGTNYWVRALAVFDDGSGPALYAGGYFKTAGGITVNGVARWDGHAWSALGDGLHPTVRNLTVFDDGSGPRLWATWDHGDLGYFAATWDGASWTPVPGVSEVASMSAVTDSRGPAIYFGGDFESAGGVSSHRFARYGCTGESCYADFSGDGALDLFDFLSFLNLFNANDPAADCDNTGAFDLFDFRCFTNAFNTGC